MSHHNRPLKNGNEQESLTILLVYQLWGAGCGSLESLKRERITTQT